MGIKKQTGRRKKKKKKNSKEKSLPFCSSSIGKRSFPEFLAGVYKGDRKGDCLLYFLRGNVLRRIINALVLYRCVNKGNRPRLSINKMVFLCIL